MNTDEILGEIRLLKKEIGLLKEAISVQAVKDQMFGPWISENEVIDLIGISRGTLNEMWKKGQISKTKLSGKGNYFLKTSFRKLLDRNVNEI